MTSTMMIPENKLQSMTQNFDHNEVENLRKLRSLNDQAVLL